MAPTYSTIVVGFDGMSQGVDAVQLARALADETTRLVVCCVYPPEVGDHGTAKRDDAERRVRVARERLADRPHTRVAVRAAFSAGAGLHEEAEESGADLLVVGSSHRGPIGRVVPGSVTRQALRAAPCDVAVAPLWLQSGGDISFGAIGVAFDGGPASEAALEQAASLAREHAGKLRLIAVIEPPGTKWSSAWAWPPPPTAGVREAVGQRAGAALTRAGGGVEGVVDVVEGVPAHELLVASAALDLLVVGSRGYGPVRRTLLGTVSGQVTEAAACPVIVVARGVEAEAVSDRIATVVGGAQSPDLR